MRRDDEWRGWDQPPPLEEKHPAIFWLLMANLIGTLVQIFISLVQYCH